MLFPIQVANYRITVSDTAGLHTKMLVQFTKGTLTALFEIKRVISTTQIAVGPYNPSKANNINDITNPIEFDGGSLTASEQQRNLMNPEALWRATYEEEPAVANRSLLVDKYGRYIDTINQDGENRLAVDIKAARPKNPAISNIPVLIANTEYSITLPAKTSKLMVKIRDGASKLRIGFDAGSTAADFIEVPRGCHFNCDDVDADNLVLYYLSDKPNVILEVMSWSY